MENAGEDFYSTTMCLDLHALGITHVSDFVFIVHSNYISVFFVFSLPSYSVDGSLKAYQDRMLELKLTQSLIQKLQVHQGRDDNKDRIALKENIGTIDFLPPVG